MDSNMCGFPHGNYTPMQPKQSPMQYGNTHPNNIPPPHIFQQPPKTPRPKRDLPIIVLLGIFGLLLVVIIVLQFVQPPPLFRATITPVANSKHHPAFSLSRFIGGFSIESDAAIANAAADGIGATLAYGYSPTETDSLSTTLKAHNMKIIDEMPWEYLYYYECHLHYTCACLKYHNCNATDFPELTSERALLSKLTAHLKQVQNNSLVIAYWILDDWTFEAGSGKDLLIQINSLIHKYTPGKPSICGFGGGLPPLPSTEYSWDDGLAKNFSPQGCDMVGLYIYGNSNTTGTYDWTMSHILPAMFTSLKKRGWDITEEPLVGIPQAFGGMVEGDLWPIPNANSVETQTKTYCQQGAIGIIYYDWGKSYQSPMTNSQITQGIKNGIADCKKIWK